MSFTPGETARYDQFMADTVRDLGILAETQRKLTAGHGELKADADFVAFLCHRYSPPELAVYLAAALRRLGSIPAG